MSETLVTELLRYCKTAYGVDLSKDSRARDLLTAELCLLKSLIELGRAVMQRWCEQLGDGYVGARATWISGMPATTWGRSARCCTARAASCS